jgi:glycosyltransferase involved in cell wall biosynthesis
VKILLVGDYPADPLLGSAKVYYKLGGSFRELGHGCDVLLRPEIGETPENWRVRQVVSARMTERAIHRAIRERGPYDVVDVASGEGWLFALRRKKSGGPAVISRSHGLEHLNYRRTLDDAADGLTTKGWTRRIYYPTVRLPQVAAAARLADGLIVLNEGDRDFAVDRGWQPADRVQVVAHGVSERFLADAPPPDSPRGQGVLFCGSWDAVKGSPYLARAMAILAEAGDAPRLTILGPGLPESAVLESFPAVARPFVRVVPRAPEDAVMRHYREHDLLVMCSTYEGFGMVVVEAMSQGLPVIATPVGCAPLVVRDGENGIMVPARDPAALAAAIRRLSSDAPLRRRMAGGASSSARQFTWRATAERTLRVYQEGIAIRSRR